MADWHPIMAAVEGPTAVWRMVDPMGVDYGRIELRRVMNGTELRYKAIWRGDVLGWSTTLRDACYRGAHGFPRRSRPGRIARGGLGRAHRARTTKHPLEPGVSRARGGDVVEAAQNQPSRMLSSERTVEPLRLFVTPCGVNRINCGRRSPAPSR